MRTYRCGSRGLARGLRSLCALVLLLPLGHAAEAQQRRYLVELGAGGTVQSYGSETLAKGSFGGFGRVGLWLPYNFSVELQAAFAGTEAETRARDSTMDMS